MMLKGPIQSGGSVWRINCPSTGYLNLCWNARGDSFFQKSVWKFFRGRRIFNFRSGLC